MFNDLSTMTITQLRDKKYMYETVFELLKMLGIISAGLAVLILAFFLPMVGVPLIVSLLTFAFLRLRAINKELDKR